MIEVIYDENAEDKKDRVKSFRLPKNIRQIGNTGENFKIYVEDYVNTYLKQLTEKDVNTNRVAILMGEYVQCSSKYLFISGAIYVEDIGIDANGVHFTDAIWSRIYENVKEYFDNLEIVGWYLSVPGFPVEINAELMKVHINQFAGSTKVLMMNEPIEGEEKFYYYENGTMKSIQGYYIYYEKNNAMQTYMIDHRTEKKEEEIIQVEQKVNTATRQFRSIVQEKQEEIQKRKMTSFMYTVSSVLVMVVLIIGITMINNYDKMNNMEKSLAILTKNSIEETLQQQITQQPITQKPIEEESVLTDSQYIQEVAVETISGNVKKKEEVSEKIPVQNVQDTVLENQAEQSQEVTEGEEPSQENISKEEKLEEQEVQTENNESKGKEEQQQETEETQSVEEPVEEPAKETIKEEIPAKEPNYYVIQEGDTLAKISIRMYNTKNKINAICEANGIEDIDKIFVGQKILLP